MNRQVPLAELNLRLERFRVQMDEVHPDWEMALVFRKVNLYYFTGTMCEGMLLIPRTDQAVFWVRRSIERAMDDSLFPNLRPMDSFRDAAASAGKLPDTVYLETEVVPLAFFQRLQKHFPFAKVQSLDAEIAAVRAIKSPWELALTRQAGQIHRAVLEDQVPGMLREGMSEVDLGVELFGALIAAGHQGVARFGMFDTEILLGHVSFGVNSLYPTSFNGAGGNVGVCPAVPLMGSRERKLHKGDLVYIDIGCGVDGYHTDKTMTYMFGADAPSEARIAHDRCVALQNLIAEQLRPGAIPAKLYKSVMERLDAEFQRNFMGYQTRRVKFLGHGVGLLVDEWPVIAEGFDAPLQEGMVLAVEPKKGVPGVGMVGIENTFEVTAQGGRNLTGDHPGLMAAG
jgi:Xaa-Pro dipeptidase